MKKLWILIVLLQITCSGQVFADDDGEAVLDLNISLEVETATIMTVQGEYDFGVQSISNKTIKSSEVMIMIKREDGEEAVNGYHISIPKEVELKDGGKTITAKLELSAYNVIEDPDDSARWRARGGRGANRSALFSEATIYLNGNEEIGSYEGEVLIKGRVY